MFNLKLKKKKKKCASKLNRTPYFYYACNIIVHHYCMLKILFIYWSMYAIFMFLVNTVLYDNLTSIMHASLHFDCSLLQKMHEVKLRHRGSTKRVVSCNYDTSDER